MKRFLTLHQIKRSLANGQRILDDMTLALSPGEKLSVLGPSGSGKTTLLRIIAGLDVPDSGDICLNEVSLLNVPSYKRNFGMMFQEFALFPHMNVFENIAYGLNMQKRSKKQVQSRVKEMLILTGMQGYENRYENELSGGEKQRVALARTLAPSPRLLMLDEPLSSLDRGLRKKLLAELIEIISILNLTTLFVTHDHEEAFAVGNKILLLNKGKIVQFGTPEQIKQTPANEWVQEFLSP